MRSEVVSGAGFAVDTEQLEEFVTQLTRFGHSLEAVRDDVQSRMNRVHAVWRGLAAQEHAAAHARWQTGNSEMHEALATMRSVVSTAHENYVAAIRVNGSLWAP